MRSSQRTRLLAALMFAISLCSIASAAPTRLAVIAQGQSAPCRGLADLLQVELSRRDGIELVEREEIDRVLAEQALTASGLVAESARIHLGALLKADGLLFVDQTVSTNNVFHLRLVETKQGYVAGFMIHAAGTPMAQTLAAIDRSLANLSLPADQRVGVSVLAFENALPANFRGEPIVRAFMADVDEKLMVELAAIPGVLVLERRQLGDVAREGAWSEAETALRAGAVFVDGALNMASDLVGEWGDPKIRLTYRVRNPASDKTALIELEGGLWSLRTLAEDARNELCAAVLKASFEAKPGTLKAEVKALTLLGRVHGLPWAAEAAFALDPADRGRARDYANSLVEGLEKLPDDRQKAIVLARVANLCRDYKLSLMSVLRVHATTRFLKYFSRYETFADPEIERLLRPVRTLLLEEFEKTNYEEDCHFFSLTCEWLDGIFKLPSTRRRYLKARIDRMAAEPGVSDSWKYFLSSYLLHVLRWKQDDLKVFAQSSDPVRRYYANAQLLERETRRDRRDALVDAMIADVEAVIGGASRMGNWVFLKTPEAAKNQERNSPRGRNNWLSASVQELWGYHPELKGKLQRMFFTRIREMTHEDDLETIYEINYATLLDTIPVSEMVDWLEELLEKSREPNAQRHPRAYLFVDTVRRRQRILDEHPELLGRGSRLRQTIVLKQADYGRRLHEFAKPRVFFTGPVDFFLHDMLLDGDTLHVLVFGSVNELYDGEPTWSLPIGFVDVDLVSGKVVSERLKWFPVRDDHLNVAYLFTRPGVLRVRDYLVCLHPSVGMLAVPVSGSGMEGCKLAGYDEGLPSSGSAQGFDGMLAPMKSGVCFWTGQWVVHWNFDTWKLKVLVDATRPDSPIAGEDGRGEIAKIISDSESDILRLVTSSGTHYRVDPATGSCVEDRENGRHEDSASVGEIAAAWKMLNAAKIPDVSCLAVRNGKVLALHATEKDGWMISYFEPGEEEADHDQ